jgi:hypothetical protein
MSIKINNEIYNLDVMDGCEECQDKNESITKVVMLLLDDLQAETVFITRNKLRRELTLFTGSSNMCNEFDCDCNDVFIPLDIE